MEIKKVGRKIEKTLEEIKMMAILESNGNGICNHIFHFHWNLMR